MKNFRALFFFGLFVLGLCAASWAQETAAAPPPAQQQQQQPEAANPNPSPNPEQNALDKDITLIPPLSATDVTLFPNGLSTGTAVAVGAVALFLILAAAWPVYGLRTCTVFGTCPEYNLPTVGTAYNNDAYSYSNPPPYTTTTYQKRSVSYVEPILRLLSSAYLQYGDSATAAATAKTASRRQRRRR